MNRLLLIFLFAALCAMPAQGKCTVIYLPFTDKVKLNEAWNLGPDVPRWFSQTVDTIGGARDSAIRSVPFDTVNALIKQNKWKSIEYLTPQVMQRIAGRYNADLVVTGTVKTFKVMKRALNTEAAMGTGTDLGSGITGGGGTNVNAGLQEYTANVKMTLSIYNGQTGALLEDLVMDSDQKDGGIKIWLPIQTDNDEINFHYLSRTPFGSVYFQKSVVGALMRGASLRLREKLAVQAQKIGAASGVGREYLQGKILEREGLDVFINLGIDDNLMLGDLFEVMKPTHPLMGDNNDTLGWAEKPVGTLRVRMLKSQHFSQATLVDSTESIQPGWSVRLRNGNGKM